ncbi:hypothetical protein [Brasilonema sp. UFV-L1]|uniref:hypothetical protein n=1 Tax=Brasilonema sp. UFV-L1 TaxID=2234130 RepID=UPI00145D2F6E|nr:hypothetical protein [Brasilonema sp. UFV-L1]NMG07200.1 hypothetical protein [Brasilonema sp. UFV-L1]
MSTRKTQDLGVFLRPYPRTWVKRVDFWPQKYKGCPFLPLGLPNPAPDSKAGRQESIVLITRGVGE